MYLLLDMFKITIQNQIQLRKTSINLIFVSIEESTYRQKHICPLRRSGFSQRSLHPQSVKRKGQRSGMAPTSQPICSQSHKQARKLQQIIPNAHAQTSGSFIPFTKARKFETLEKNLHVSCHCLSGHTQSMLPSHLQRWSLQEVQQ